MAKIRKKYITENIDERYYSIVNNINDDYTHKRINDGTANNDLIKSGVASSSKAKKLSASNSEMGTLPSNVITSGKELQDFNDLFDETNILVFSDNATSINTNSCIGLPLISLTDVNGVAKGFYITTDEALIAKNTISESDTSFFKSKYALENSKVYDTPNSFENSFNNKRGIDSSLNSTHSLYQKNVGKIASEIDEHVLTQNRFQEEYVPFSEDYSSFAIPGTSDDDYSFYYDTVDREIKDGYSLGEQKQIKIVLDFNDSADLLLLNTKMTFNLPSSTYDEVSFTDTLTSTRYFNFLNGNAGDSYSSHFMPTAYWNFNNKRWSYLDGSILEADDYTQLTISDFPVSTADEIKYSYLGAKNTSGNSLSISPNIVFDASSTISSSSIQNSHLSNSVLSVFNKPILTTPSFRNDGSLNSLNKGALYNKTSLSKITSSYGFPYKANWQPNNSHLLNMSKYINNDFLLEKVVIEGTYTSRGEMPVKKGNFSSGYSESGNPLSSLLSFNSMYNMKDSHHDYISNCLTFFILNERKGLNYIDQKTYPDLHQSYFLSKELSSVLADSKNTSGKKLKNFLGEFKTYELYQDTLKVYSQIIPNSYLYKVDEYNSIKIEDTYTFNSNNKKCSLSLYKSVFHYLDEASNSGSGDIVDSIYILNVDDSDSLYQNNLLSDSENLKFNIRTEYNQNSITTDFNRDTSRELVTYSNFLIANKYSDITLDEEALSNIDKKQIVDTADVAEDLHLNMSSKTKFKVNSFVKSINNSSYTDESVYKIKSNYKERVVSSSEEASTVAIGISDNLVISDKPDNSYLFNFDNSSASDGHNITHMFNQSITPIVSTTSLTPSIPFSLYYQELCFQIDVDGTGIKTPVYYLIKFSYKNPSNYSDRDNYSSEPYLTISDFIETSEYVSNNTTYNVVDLNLRFLDPWDDRGILASWLSHRIVHQDSSKTVYKFLPLANDVVKVSSGDDFLWSKMPSDNQYMALIKFIIFGLYEKVIYKKDGTLVSGSKRLYDYLSSEKEVVLTKNSGSAEIRFYESTFDPYSASTGKSINISLSDEHRVHSEGLFDIVKNIEFDSLSYRGQEEEASDELFYNYNVVLEGKSAGTPDNVGTSSDRVMNKTLMSSSNRALSNTKSISGKTLLEANNIDSASNANYLLKPEDQLVFGVTSNANGEVMPTVISLHDKLEITLIGRDYISQDRQKTNESKSIRKTVVGDNNITRSGTSIYQTKATYYDNVWNKTEMSSSLEDFKEGKLVIGRNSSRDFGTYTGISSFDKLFNSDRNIVYKTDSVNPSVANVFFNCLDKEPLFTQNSQDMFNYRNNNTLTPASYKILLSDKISSSRLTSFPNRYANIVSDWHNTFHLSTYSAFFDHVENPSSIVNKKIDDYSYDVFSSYANKTNSTMSIYCDVNSYSAGLNYEDSDSQSLKSKSNKDYSLSSSDDSLYRYYKTFKTYMLPYSSSQIYQNALQINNNKVDVADRFLYRDILIDKDFTKSKVYSAENYSIQYMIHDILPEFCDVTKDVAMDLYGNDSSKGISSWCLVIELNDAIGSSLINEIDIKHLGTFTSNFTINSADSEIKYYNSEVWLSFSKYPGSGIVPDDMTSASSITKKFKIVADSTSDTVYFLVAPLYFWETNEINPLTDQALSETSVTSYGRGNQLYNDANNKDNISSLSSAWYASLNNSSFIFSNNGIYDVFLANASSHNDALKPPAHSIYRKIDITGNNNTGTTLMAPFTISYLLSNNIDIYTNPTADKGFLVSLSNSKLIYNSNKQNNPVFLHESNNLDKLNNSYLLDSDAIYFSSEEYLDNNLELIEIKKEYRLNVEKSLNFDLNEKIYFSNCKNVNLDGSVSDTTVDFIYSIKNQHIGNTSSEQEYSVIELKALHNNYTLLRKNRLLEDTLIYCIDNNTSLKMNEDSLLKSSKAYAEDNNFSSPCFEIDISGKLTNNAIDNYEKIYQIPYSNYELDYEYDITSDPSNNPIDSSGSEDVYVNSGSPVYELSRYPAGYNSKEEQEGKTKDFFYGYSRGSKTKYPVNRLDGFKYGVESGSKKSLNYHYSNSRFGNLSDKIMGSKNYANMYLDNGGVTMFTWPVEKLFVNEYFQYVKSTEVQNIYNTDKYSRSKHPFIEDETNNLSQFYVPPVA